MEWLSNKAHSAMEKIETVVDQAQEKMATRIITALEPRLHTEIDERVDAFRDSTLQELPRRCEEGLQAKTDSSTVAWVVHKVLGDRTDVLVERLLERFRPGVTSATDGLSVSATRQILDLLKDLLDGRDEDEAAAVSQQVQQLQVSEEQGADGEASASSGGFRAAAKGLVSGAYLEGRMPSFEESARTLVHPLFEQLKTQIWELVPSTLQDVLGDLVGEEEGDVEAEAADDGDGAGGGSWLGRLQSRLSGKASRVLDKVVAATLDAVDGPLQGVINRLVDELEGSALDASFKQIRAKLAEYHLVSAEA